MLGVHGLPGKNCLITSTYKYIFIIKQWFIEGASCLVFGIINARIRVSKSKSTGKQELDMSDYMNGAGTLAFTVIAFFAAMEVTSAMFDIAEYVSVLVF